MDTSNDYLVAAELESVENRLRCAVEDLDAAAAAMAWVEQESGADWSGRLPSAMDLRDSSQQLRTVLHRLITLEGETSED